MQAAKEVAFGAFRLDPINECLWQDTRAISLRPKAFAVLKLLVQQPGQLVTKQQILDTVWPGTFVGDAVLKDNIRRLRDALNDDAGSPTYIETAHRRGYRFIAKLSYPLPDNEGAVGHEPAQTIRHIAYSPATPTEVFGRDAELAKMRGWLDRALAGDRQVVFVTGEPGMGKTTVVQEFLKQVGHVTGILVVHGQCLEHHGSGEAYLPLLEGFSRLSRSPERARVIELLRQHAPTWLAQMPSLIPTPDRDNFQSHIVDTTRERMLREMADAIEALTVEAPLVLVVEDLHWSDYSTLDLVSYLARRRDSARLMVIGTYRPVDAILSDHPLKGVKLELEAHGLCHELPLEYLTEVAIDHYLATRFPDHRFPGRVRRTIYRRTEGNPLFMVNLVKYLIDQRVIVEEQGTWRLRVDLSEVEQVVPSNLRELIERKIEQLTPDQRIVLDAASVVSMECSSLAIAAGLNMPTEYVEKHCQELAYRHQVLSSPWLVELPDGTMTLRYRFNHILYREVAYKLVPAIRRGQIHHRIAERGVAIYGERDTEIAAELAMHFEESRDWPSALKYLLRAAENAADSFAHHEAANLARRGLQVLKSLPDTPQRAQQEIKLRMILGVSLMAIKGFASAEVEEVYARGRELFWMQGPSPELFHMLWSLNLYYQFSGEVQPSLQISELLLELAEGMNEAPLIMEARRAMGAALVVQGQFVEALEHLDEASALYATHRRHPHSIFIGLDCKVICECFAGRALWALGCSEEAVERTAGALQLARELGHHQTLMVAGHFAAQLHQLNGEVVLAHERAKEAVELADECGLELWLAYGLVELGWAEAELGDRKCGIEQMQRGVAAYEATGAKLWSSYYLQLLADQLAKAGRVEEGLVVIAKALKYADESGERYSLAELHRLHGELTIKASRRTPANKIPQEKHVISKKSSPTLLQAGRCFEQALAIAKQQRAKSWQWRAQMSIDRLANQV